MSWSREIADTFQIADDAGHVIHILAVAMRTLLEIALVDMSAIVADGIGDVECKIVAPLLGRHAQQLSVLRLREMLVEVGMKGRAAGEMLDIRSTVHLELVNDVERIVLDKDRKSVV